MKYIPSDKIAFPFNNQYCELKWIEDDLATIEQWDGEHKIKINDLTLCIPEIRNILNDIYYKLYTHLQHNISINEYQYLRELEGKIYNLTYKAIENEGLTKKQAETIMGLAYDHGHSAGMSEVVNHAIEFMNFAKEILNNK